MKKWKRKSQEVWLAPDGEREFDEKLKKWRQKLLKSKGKNVSGNVNNKLAAETEKTDSVKWNRRKAKIQQRLFPTWGACTPL